MDMVEEEARVEREQKQAELDRLRESEHWRKTLSTYDGRAVVWDLLSATGIFRDIFYGEETHSAARAMGKRSLGLLIYEKVFTFHPEAYTLMQAEFLKRKAEAEKI
jgi:hypothetical protein